MKCKMKIIEQINENTGWLLREMKSQNHHFPSNPCIFVGVLDIGLENHLDIGLENHLCALPSDPSSMIFPIWHCFQHCVCPELLPLILLWVLSPVSAGSLTHMHCSVLCWTLRWTICWLQYCFSGQASPIWYFILFISIFS